MQLVAKHQVAGWGWQQGCMTSCCSGAHCNCETSNPVGCPAVPPPGFTPTAGHEDEEAELRKQALAFQSYLANHKETAATQGVFAYRQLTNAAWWWRKNYAAYTNPATRGYFFTSDKTGDYCWLVLPKRIHTRRSHAHACCSRRSRDRPAPPLTPPLLTLFHG